MRAPLLVSTALLLVACGGTEPVASTPAPTAETAGVAAAPVAATPPPKEAAPATNPAILALAKPALECKFEDGYFEDECAALTAWKDNEPLFEEGKGNDTLLAMLGDPDEKMRVLVAEKHFDDSRTYFTDEARARRLFALAAKETNPGVAHELGGFVAKVDAEKFGLGAEERALAKHPVVKFRESLAFYTISSFQTPTALDVEQILIDDPEDSVKSRAISALSTGGITPGAPPVCALLKKQMERTDKFAGGALWAASSSKCAGMDELVIAELEKRTADPSKVTNAVGVNFSLAAQGVCGRTASADLKKKGFAMGKALVSAKVPDPNTRSAAMAILVSCDREAAAKVIAPFAKDKDKYVADAAKSKLAELKKK